MIRISREQLSFSKLNPSWAGKFVDPAYLIGAQIPDLKRRGITQAAGVLVPAPPVAHTEITSLQANGMFKTEGSLGNTLLVAVTLAPESLERATQEKIQGISDWTDWGFPKPSLQDPPLDNFFCTEGPFDRAIFLRRNRLLTGEPVADAIRSLGIKNFLGWLPNPHVGFEEIASDASERLTEFNLRYTPLEVARILASKSAYRQWQKDNRFTVPEASPVIETGNRKRDKKELLRYIKEIHEATGKPVVIKADDLYGSVGYRKIDFNLLSEEGIERVVESHLEDRDQSGSHSSYVEEFMTGTEIGCHITIAGGEIQIDYTLKTMATGRNKSQSEEIAHTYDPHNPILKQCEDILTPILTEQIELLGLDKCNISLNGDALLEEDKGKILELNNRLGGVAIPQMFDKVHNDPRYSELILRANLGDTDAVAQMQRIAKDTNKPKQAARVETTLPYYEGFVIQSPDYDGNPGRENDLFYQARYTFASQNPKYPDLVAYMHGIGDYLDKTGHPIIGAYGPDIETVQRVIWQKNAQNGIMGITRNGVIYVDPETGGYIRRRVDPDFPLGKFLIKQGIIFERGRWRVPVAA